MTLLTTSLCNCRNCLQWRRSLVKCCKRTAVISVINNFRQSHWLGLTCHVITILLGNSTLN